MQKRKTSPSKARQYSVPQRRRSKPVIAGKNLVGGLLLVGLFSFGYASAAHLLHERPTPKPGPAKHLAALAYGDKDNASHAPSYTEDALSQIIGNINKLPAEEIKHQLKDIYTSEHQPETSRREAAYVLARMLQKSASPDDLKEAIKLYEDAAHIEPLWERCQWHISECAQTLGQEKLVHYSLELVKTHATSVNSRAQAEYGLAQSYLRGNEPERAKEAFELIRKDYPHSPFALGSAYYLGESIIDTKEGQKEALGLFRDYIKKSPDGHFAQTIVKRIAALKDYEPTEYDHSLFGKVNYSAGQWQDALNEWSKGTQPSFWYYQAVCFSRLGKQAEAIDILQSGIKQHPNDGIIPTAATMLCRMLNKEQAIAVWKGILETSQTYKAAALFNLGTRADGAQAIAYFNELVTKHPDSQHAPEANWWLVWEQVKQGKTQAALNLAKSSIDKYPGNRVQPRFAFWAGKLSERLNSKESAKTLYKRAIALGASNYYGHRSQARLQALSGGADPGWTMKVGRTYPDQNWKWPEAPRVISYNEIALKSGPTCALLCKLGQWDECLQLLPEKTNPLIRSLVFANLNLPLDAINSAAIHTSGTPKKIGLWMFAYPLLYSNQVAKDSQDNQLDPYLVHGLIREESRYNAMATSRSNAIGLMQLLPGTAFGVAKNMGLNIHSNDEIYNPTNNIALGTHYLAYVLKRHNGNALAAVASYNGGPNAVAKWIKGHADMDVFVENIPVTETRDYVRKVFGSFWNYQSIYR